MVCCKQCNPFFDCSLMNKQQLPNAMIIISNAETTVVQMTGIATWREKDVIFPACFPAGRQVWYFLCQDKKYINTTPF